MRKNLLLVGFSLLFVFCVVFSATASGEQEAAGKSTEKAEPMTLVLWDWHAPRQALVDEKIAEYEEQNPNIKFETSIMPFQDYWKKAMTALTSKKVPDIWNFHNSKTGVFLEYLAPYPAEQFPNMEKNFLMFEQAFEFEGKFYFYPVGLMSSVIFYNTNYWEEAGMPEITETIPWEEMKQLAKKMTKYDDAGNVSRAGLGLNGYMGLFWNALHYQMGGHLFNENGTEATWDTEGGLRALEYIHELIFEEKVTEPGFLSFEEAMGTENAAMVYSWTWMRGFLDHNYPDLEYSVFPLPTPDGDPSPAIARNNFEVGHAVFKAAAEERQREAFKFIKWLYDDEDFMAELNTIMATSPADTRIWDHELIAGDEVINTLTKYIDYTIFPGEFPAALWDSGGLATLEDYIMNGASPQEALTKADEEADRILSERPIGWVVEHDYQPPN